MKKKILLTILVILLVGVLTASVIACTGNSGGTNKPNKTDKTDKDNKKDDKGDVEESNLNLTKDLTNIVNELDKTIQTVSKIEDEGSVNATIYLDLNTGAKGAEPLNLAISIAGSMDSKTGAKNWADISVKNGEKDLFGLAIRSSQDGKETLYIGQPIVSGEYQWVKLSQFEDASLFYGKAISALQNLLAKAGWTYDEEGNVIENKGEPVISATWKSIQDGNLINGYVGGFLPMASVLSGLFKVDAGATTTKVGDAYILDLDVAKLGDMMGSLSSLLSSLELPQEYLSLVNMGVKLLLGSEVTFAESEKNPGKYVISGINTVEGESIPSIKISVGSKDGKTTGVGLAYEKDDFKLALGIKDLALNASAASASDIKADELAIKLSANLDGINGMVDGGANLDVVIQPNVKVGFWGEEDVVEGTEYSKDGYVKIDFSGLYGYANLNGTTIADYNLSSEKGFAIDISKVVDVLGLSEDIAIKNKYIVPFDAQSMFNSWIDNMVIAANAEQPANAASTNIVDNVWGIVESFIKDGKFNFDIGAVGDILALVTGEGEDSLLAIAKGIIEEVVVKNKKGEVIGIELDLGELMAKDGAIGSIINGSEKLAGLKVADAYNAEGEKNVEVYLLDLLAGDKLFDYVLGFINAAVYEAHGAELGMDNINDFAEWVEYSSISTDGYTWTTLQDVKDLANKIFGIEGSAIDALRKNIYGGTKISIDLSNAGAVELSISLAGKTASIGGGVAFVDNVAIANHKATQKINVEDAIDLTKDNNWKGIANIGLEIINSYLPEKYQVNYIPVWALYTADGDEIAIYEDGSIKYNGEEVYNIESTDTGYTFTMRRQTYSLDQEDGVWYLSHEEYGEKVVEALSTEKPRAKVLEIGAQTVSASADGIAYTLTASKTGTYKISSADVNAYITYEKEEGMVECDDADNGKYANIELSEGDVVSVYFSTFDYSSADEYEVIVEFTAQA